MEPAVAANCRLEVSAGLTNVEIVVTDGLFREVARGTGHVSLPHIPPGLYKIEARAGGTTESRFVSLKPGDEVSEEVARVHDVPTMAPVYGGVTDREPHHAAATRGTIAVRDAAGPSAALVVLIRTLRGGKPHPLSVNQLSLVDRRLDTVAEFGREWEQRDDEHWALWAGRLEPGGYALRTHGDLNMPTIDQSLWLSDGWITIVFCSTGPSRPRVADAAIHMLRIGETWDSVDDQLVSTLEVALSGLRQGLPLASDDMMRLLLNMKFFDPMLGIVGAHTLRLRESYDQGLMRTVVDNLGGLVPGHPDAQALRYAVGESGPRDLRWPPMLAASYRDLLLPAESADPRVLADGSVAERIAAYLAADSPWLCWRADEEILPPRPAAAPPSAAAPVPADPSGADFGPGDHYDVAEVGGQGDPWTVPIGGVPYGRHPTKAAVRTVERYLEDAEHVLQRPPDEIARDMGVKELAARTNLPHSTVDAALRELELPLT